jgi:transcription elongation factor Elf1
VLIICGLRSYLELLGIVTLVCRVCDNPVAQRIEEQVRKVTLYFVPIFPIGRRTLMTCSYCGHVTELTAEDVAQILVHSHAGVGRDEAGGRQPQGLTPNGDHHPDA